MNGIDGNRATFRCPTCRKRFTYWRPEALPGAKVKCYYCRAEVEDEASRRAPLAPAAPAPAPAPPPPAAPGSP